MKNAVIQDYADMFPDAFLPYAADKEIEGKVYREVYFQCVTCGERAKQDVQDEGVRAETVLSCKCRSNHSFGMDVWDDLVRAAQAVKL